MARKALGRIAGAVLTIALTSTVGLVAATGPALAVPGMEMVTAVSALNTESPKEVAAQCPRGSLVLDGGAYLTGGGQGNVHLTALRPNGDAFRAVAVASNREFRGSWQLHSYAICSSMSEPIRWGASRTTALSTQYWRNGTINCTNDRKVVGLGAEVRDGNGNPATGVALHIIQPSDDLTRAYAAAFRIDDNYQESWQLTMWVICAEPPLPGLTLVKGHGQVPGGPAAATCPTGTRVHGVAGLINAAPTQALITGMYPSGDLTSTVTIGHDIVGGANQTWLGVSYAICAH